MEKHTAHYNLTELQAIVKAKGISAFTRTAIFGYNEMGLDIDQAIGVVLSLTRAMLYKSMTTYADHKVWQDVYWARCPNGKTAYIKLTKTVDAVVIQFKEQ